MIDNHEKDRRNKPLRPISDLREADVLVSVVIPTFRRAGFLKESLRSVCAQTHRPLQIIVVDDDDDPATGEIVGRTFAGAEELEAVFLRQPNLGPAAARNLGLSVARGAYVQFLDDDDTLFPDKIAKQVTFLEESGADVVFGDWFQGQDIASARRFVVGENRNHFVFLTADGWIPPFSYLCRKQSCHAVDGWNEAVRYKDDFDFFLRLAASGASFHHQPLFTGFYRWHKGARVSREVRAARIDADIAIIASVEHLRRARAAITTAELQALLVYWRKIATEAEGAQFEECQVAISRLRSELGETAGALEGLLGPRRYYGLRGLGGPVRWSRHLMHRLLPLAARRAVRRWENGMRDAISHARRKA